jgi:hypothetical protein
LCPSGPVNRDGENRTRQPRSGSPWAFSLSAIDAVPPGKTPPSGDATRAGIETATRRPRNLRAANGPRFCPITLRARIDPRNTLGRRPKATVSPFSASGGKPLRRPTHCRSNKDSNSRSSRQQVPDTGGWRRDRTLAKASAANKVKSAHYPLKIYHCGVRRQHD